MEYGYRPRDDHRLESVLLTGAAAATGLFALGHMLRPWANKQLAAEVAKFTEKEVSTNADRMFAHELAFNAPEASSLQALAMGVARSRAMKYWKTFAQTNQVGRLIDDLGFVRELRESYGASQIRRLGQLDDLAIFHHGTPEGFLPSQSAYYASGKLWAVAKGGELQQLPGKYWMYGKAAAGESKSVFEKSMTDLSGRSRDKGWLLEYRASQLKAYGALFGLNKKELEDKGEAGVLALRPGDLPRAKRREARQLQYTIKKLDKATKRDQSDGALHRLARALDVGQNERGATVLSREWWDQFGDSLGGILHPEDISQDRKRNPFMEFDVVHSFKWNDWHSYAAVVQSDGSNANLGTILGLHLFNRINTSVAWNGLFPWLALSSDSLSLGKLHGPGAFAANIMLKRALPLYAAGFYAGYLNDEIGRLTGERPSDHVRAMRGNLDLNFAGWKDRHGISKFARDVDDLSSGALGYLAHPFIDVPVGLSQQQLADWQQHGEVAVRKGRWWSFGSSTPFRGERIQYFTPNYTRYGKAGDVYKTSTLWGSPDEYYANAALPTPTHPFAPIQHFVTDRYHYEHKHYADRPYPVSAPLFEPTTPWGAVLNPLLGWLLKPPEHYHQADLPYALDGSGRKNQAYFHRHHLRALNQEIKDAANAKAVTGFVTPSGAIAPMAMTTVPGGPSLREVNQEIIDDGDEAAAGYDEGVPIGSYGQGARAIAPYGSGKQKARVGVREMNTAQRFTKRRMLEPASAPGVFTSDDPNDPRALRRLISSHDPRYQAGLAYYSLTELGGIYGFGAVSATGDQYADLPTLQNAGRMTSFERTYWDRWNLGGIAPTPGLSEAFRRFLPHRFHSNTEYNPIRNTMPSWLPGQEGEDPAYFTDFLHGDPYVAVPNGEVRLPGAAYEKLHGIRNGQYSDLDRFAILADVAPWSAQYRRYRDYLVHSDLTDEERARVNTIKGQVTERKHRYDFHPYRVRYSKLNYETVHVKDVIDNNTFTTREHPDNPVRLAGVHLRADDQATEWISRFIKPGEQLRIGVAQDPSQTIAHDSLHTMRAVVYSHGQMLNRLAIDEGAGSERDENNPAGINVKYTARELQVAGLLETFAHAPIPILHNKFMPIDSPLELYKRTQVYGKDWQDWRHPLRDYLFPSFEAFAQQGWIGMAGAAFLGYELGIGKLFERGMLGFPAVPKARAFMALGSMAIAAGLALYRNSQGQAVPSYRNREREVDEYFDTLKYVKYEGLYEKTRSWISKHEHHDIGALVDKYHHEGEERKRRIQILKSEKRKLIVSGQKTTAHERILQINREINELQSYRQQLSLSRADVLALQYKQVADQTLRGAETGGPLQNVLMALPAKEREFFQAFLKAPGPEREAILRVVPQNERRFLESAWGMQTDPQQSLGDYFKHHYLPHADWKGWKSDSNLDDYKLVVMKQEGLDMTSHGFWPQDEERVKEKHIPDLRPRRKSDDLRNQLHRSLAGLGLKDVDIDLMPTRSGRNSLELRIEHERKDRNKREHLMI